MAGTKPAAPSNHGLDVLPVLLFRILRDRTLVDRTCGFSGLLPLVHSFGLLPSIRREVVISLL